MPFAGCENTFPNEIKDLALTRRVKCVKKCPIKNRATEKTQRNRALSSVARPVHIVVVPLGAHADGVHRAHRAGKGSVMETIKSFLQGKGVSAETLASWPDDQCRAVAQAMGLALPKAPKILLLAHTNAKGKTGVFVVDATGYPEVWEKVNEGDTVTAEGLEAFKARQAARLAMVTVGTKGAIRAKK